MSSTCSGSGARPLGTLVGGVLGDPNAIGLDAAFAALFLALALPYLRDRRSREAAALAAAITLVLTPFTPAGVPDRRSVGRVPPRAAPMSASWVVVAVVGLATVAFKAAGPVIVGRRQLPPRLQSLVELLAPVMLTALVVTQTFGGDEGIASMRGSSASAAALVALRLRAHIIVAMVVAAATTALVRLVCLGPRRLRVAAPEHGGRSDRLGGEAGEPDDEEH